MFFLGFFALSSFMPLELMQKARAKDVRALARLISKIELRNRESLELMVQLYAERQGAQVIGITGPPGAGKSTLVNQLIGEFRKRGKKVGVIAIDPSSPFSGGALLGDRIRMIHHATDKEVFIRSLGSRGAKGGLSRAAGDIAVCLNAVGFDVVLIETVGVGQTELDILSIADTTVVVMVPEAGDAIQTMKAGLMEIADVFVVNKADRPGAKEMLINLKASLSSQELKDAKLKETKKYISHHDVNMDELFAQQKGEGWEIPVLSVVATKGEGVTELVDSLDQHKTFSTQDKLHHEKQKSLREQYFLDILRDELGRRVLDRVSTDANLAKNVQAVREDKKNLYQALDECVNDLLK